MDRATGFPLQRSAGQRHSCRRKSQRKLFDCLLAFCLLAVLMLALAVFYLLSRHLREPQDYKGEEGAVRMPEFQKQFGMPPATELKPKAHLQVFNPHKVNCVPGEFPTLLWKPDIEDKIKYENGSLVISKHGNYFVYAQVTFRNLSTVKDNCGTGNKAVTHVQQIISKLSVSYPVPRELLRSSCSIGKTPKWNHALYSGAIIALKENDKLFVNVSNAKLVHNDAKATFFGAFLI